MSARSIFAPLKPFWKRSSHLSPTGYWGSCSAASSSYRSIIRYVVNALLSESSEGVA